MRDDVHFVNHKHGFSLLMLLTAATIYCVHFVESERYWAIALVAAFGYLAGVSAVYAFTRACATRESDQAISEAADTLHEAIQILLEGNFNQGVALLEVAESLILDALPPREPQNATLDAAT